MIRIIEHALKECITKSMLRSHRPIELFYENKFSKSDGDPRKTWQVINELTSRKRAGPRLGSWVWMVFQ